jgi:hypothetical protein
MPNAHISEMRSNSLFQIEQGTGSSPEPQCIYGLLGGQNYKFKIKTNQKWLKIDGITKTIYLACF